MQEDNRSQYNNTFQIIYEKYYYRAFQLAFSITRNKEIAEDAVQDAFVSAFISLNKVKNPKKIDSWIFTIVKNKAYNYLRKKKWRNNIRNKLIKSYNNSLSKEESISEALEKEETKKEIIQIINSLPHKYSEILTLIYYSHLSYKEVADALNISKANVRIRHHRAKSMLNEKYRLLNSLQLPPYE